MSIGIAVAVPEGIALASDTLNVLDRLVTNIKEKKSKRNVEIENPIRFPIGFSKKVKKIIKMEINGSLYGVCTSGTVMINNKNIFALFKELERKCSGKKDFNEIAGALVAGIKAEFKEQYNVTDLSKAPPEVLNFILAGFKNNDITKPIIESHMVFCGKYPHQAVMNDSGHIVQSSNFEHHKYGGCWIGRSELITHVVNHKNKELPPINNHFELMSLSSAVEYCRFLTGFVCDYQEFALVTPDCGRPIMTATLTPEHYHENIEN